MSNSELDVLASEIVRKTGRDLDLVRIALKIELIRFGLKSGRLTREEAMNLFQENELPVALCLAL